MRPSTVVGALAVLTVGVWAVGSIVSLVINALAGPAATAAAAVVVLLGLVVLATAVVGAKGPRWVYNSGGHYW